MKFCIYAVPAIIALSCLSLCSMDTSANRIVHKRAEKDDIRGVLKLTNEQAHADSSRIVVLPKIFRKQAITDSVKSGKLFVAQMNNEIVAFKKLYIISDEKEYDNIVDNELRCRYSQDSVSVQINEVKTNSFAVPNFGYHNSICIYFGGDYTAPAHRNKKVNSNLTRYAFSAITHDAFNVIENEMLQYPPKKEISYNYIVLLYGLTKANAGEGSGEIDRNPSIIRAFKKFVMNFADLCQYNKDEAIIHSRYKSFMPTFDPEATECVSLPDDQAIAGYGNVLIFPLVSKNK